MPPNESQHRTIVAAHRGGALLWPENSLTAFKGAISLGVQQIETDTHLSSDGEPVIIHDPTLERTTLAKGHVRDLPWEVLSRIGLRDAEGDCIPHLEDVTKLLQPTDIVLRLELKNDADKLRYRGMAEIVHDRLRNAGMLDQTVFTSFDWDYLHDLRAIDPDVAFIGLIDASRFEAVGGIVGAIALAESCQVEEIAYPINLLEPGAVEAAADHGLSLGVYGVKTEQQTRRAFDLGVAHFTADRPDMALELASERYRRR